MIKKILLCALCLAFVCLGFGCEREPDFGEEGRWEYSEKLSLYFGGNAGGLSLEAYIDRANRAAKNWPRGLVCRVEFHEELITGEMEYAFEDGKLNAFLTRLKGHELLIREDYGLPETGDVTDHDDYSKEMSLMVGYGYAEFLDFPHLAYRNEWRVVGASARIVFAEIPEKFVANLVSLSESPLVKAVSLSVVPVGLVDA